MHLVACQFDDLTRHTHAKSHQSRATKDHADVTCELIVANNGDQKVVKSRRSNHLYLSRLHNKERHVVLAAIYQHFTARDWTKHSVGCNPLDLLRGQPRKHERLGRGVYKRCRTSDLGQYPCSLNGL